MTQGELAQQIDTFVASINGKVYVDARTLDNRVFYVRVETGEFLHTFLLTPEQESPWELRRNVDCLFLDGVKRGDRERDTTEQDWVRDWAMPENGVRDR